MTTGSAWGEWTNPLRYTLGTTVYHSGNQVAKIALECPICHDPISVPVFLRSVSATRENDHLVISVHISVDDFLHECKKKP